ncbi:MAG TPA: polysaccharide biosynthesis protein, partial [Candidatus Deferrimicrobium sp.]
FTGLRPGEKLHEELIVEGEDVSGTTHPKVMKLIGNERIPSSWEKRLEELIACAVTGERCGVVEKLDALVKGYRPNYEFHGVAVPEHARAASPGATSPAPPPEGDLPPDPASPSKSVH